MDEAVRHDRGGIREALLAQTALVIAILLAAPLRISTLISLNADEHIIRSRSGSRAVVYLVIPAANVKNRVPLEFVLPPKAVERSTCTGSASGRGWLQLRGHGSSRAPTGTKKAMA